eukprot:8390658-Alexandrium_andersonii.AAC.1
MFCKRPRMRCQSALWRAESRCATFSRTTTAGSVCSMVSATCQNASPRPSESRSPSFLPLGEKGWHGHPAAQTSSLGRRVTLFVMFRNTLRGE